MGEIEAESEPMVSNTGRNGGEEPHMTNKKNDHNHTVEIVLRTVGPARPSRLRVSSSIKVCDLRQLIAEDGNLPIENLRLIFQGNVLHDNSGNGEDVYLKLNDGDSLIVAVKPKPPVKHLRNEFDDDDDDEDLKFQLPQSSSRWKRKLYSFLHDKLKLPDILLMAIFSLSLKAWAVIVLWFILAPVAHKFNLGRLFVALEIEEEVAEVVGNKNFMVSVMASESRAGGMKFEFSFGFSANCLCS
ncbi:uncharacterized protein LOC133853757 isoform X2 [Alnus glutinosa]|uniref:uncharacterized protein LOC133853757 isoform X2 n=1 Tax=Alnus glutinosa TaxID=3517 RepID=UPI002D7699B6|nr:uncharacterized protein LOC133853757 isoform X2 [Alnus glutinosa]